jgi:hypothetical protein
MRAVVALRNFARHALLLVPAADHRIGPRKASRTEEEFGPEG